MRQKEYKAVITFHTTAEAIAMEKACKENGCPGRLIPVPRQISSGCGLAYSAPADMEEELRNYMTTHHLQYESVGIYLI